MTCVVRPPKCLVPFRRRLLLFQSYRQLAYTIVIILVVNLILDLILPFHNFESYLGVFLFSTAAVAYYNWWVFPYELIVDTNQWPQAVPLVVACVEKFFKEVRREGPTTLYAENLPEYLTWDEARVLVTVEPHKMRVVGPGMMVSRLYRRLEQELKLQDARR